MDQVWISQDTLGIEGRVLLPSSSVVLLKARAPELEIIQLRTHPMNHRSSYEGPLFSTEGEQAQDFCAFPS